MIKKKIKMDLSISNAPQIVYAVQGDTNTRNVVIDLYNSGAAWIVPDGTSGVVKFQKADGKGGIYDKLPNGFPAVVYEENSNQIEVSLAPQVLTFPGEVKSQVSLIYDNNIISTFSFVVLVQEDPSANAEKSTDYVNWDRYFIPQTSGATVGQYLKITKVDSLGRVIEVSPVDAPSGGGAIDGDLDMKSDSILNVGSVELWNEDELATVIMQSEFPEGDNESENFNGVIEFRTSRGDEPVVIRNVADAKNPNEAVNKKQLEEYILELNTGGMSKTLRVAIYNLLMDAVYQSANHESDKDALSELLTGIGDDEGDTDPILSSISATYSGGEVPVGTAVSSLNGIVVIAHYSDGSTETVTGYTLSGEIVEGSNTITVTYGGKTTTFTVNGVPDSAGGPLKPVATGNCEIQTSAITEGTVPSTVIVVYKAARYCGVFALEIGKTYEITGAAIYDESYPCPPFVIVDDSWDKVLPTAGNIKIPDKTLYVPVVPTDHADHYQLTTEYTATADCYALVWSITESGYSVTQK